MNIQIFGQRKCFETKKAERYFKERRLKYQYIDLESKGLSKGELQSVKAALGLNALINTGSKEYGKHNLDKISSPSVREELLFNNPALYNTPIVRNGRQATVGYAPKVWDSWE